MRRLTLPVVAHRIYGLGRDERTAWSADSELPEEAPHTTSEVGPLTRTPLENPYSQGRRLTDLIGTGRGAGRSQMTSPGTRRSVAEIRDLIDGDGRAETSGDYNLNQIWEQAGIAFRLVAVVDHTILPFHAEAMLYDDVYKYPRRFNQVGVINMYFFRSLIGALGVAYFSAFPNDPAKNEGYAAVQDLEEWGFRQWDNFVETMAHEVGHLLTLPHDSDIDNLMARTFSPDHANLRSIQSVVARACAARYLPAIRHLRAMSPAFREVFDNPDNEPLEARAYRGERWRFGEDVSRRIPL